MLFSTTDYNKRHKAISMILIYEKTLVVAQEFYQRTQGI